MTGRRAREGLPFSSRAGEQRPLLMPINGGSRQGSSARAPIDGIAELWPVFNDWQPDEAIAQWAAENVSEVRNPLDPRIVDRFKDHWRANKPMPPRDIAAAFRLWLGREREFANGNGRPRLDRSRILEDVAQGGPVVGAAGADNASGRPTRVFVEWCQV